MPNSALLRTFLKHERELVTFLTRRLGSVAVAADIAQDLYIKLLSQIRPRSVRDDRAYLFAIAANLATDYLRVERRRSEILSEVGGLAWGGQEDITPERHALARAELAFLNRAIGKLPQRCRRILRLYRYEGLSQEEISKQMNIGVTTVYKDLQLVLHTLQSAKRRFHQSTRHRKNSVE